MPTQHPICAALAVTLLLGLAGPGIAGQPADESMQHSDRNGDAFVDRGEFHARMTDVFYANDADRDGLLVLAELDGVSAAGFASADRNGDGKLSLAEYVNARFVDFRAADKDGDGRLSAAEVADW